MLNRDLVIIELEAIAFHLNEQERQKVIAWVKVKAQATWSEEFCSLPIYYIPATLDNIAQVYSVNSLSFVKLFLAI